MRHDIKDFNHEAKVLWFNRAKCYGEAEIDGGHKVFISDTENVYKPGEKVLLRFDHIDTNKGFLKPGDLYATWIKKDESK